MAQTKSLNIHFPIFNETNIDPIIDRTKKVENQSSIYITSKTNVTKKCRFRVSRVAKLQLLQRTRERTLPPQDFATLKVANPFADFRAQSLGERNEESDRGSLTFEEASRRLCAIKKASVEIEMDLKRRDKRIEVLERRVFRDFKREISLISGIN